MLVEPFRLATRPICNAEVLAFIADGGYREPRLWLSDGWRPSQREGWTAPLYWERQDGVWLHYTLGGVREVDPAETACHLSYYEADAIARWAGARLPTEAEWEHAARACAIRRATSPTTIACIRAPRRRRAAPAVRRRLGVDAERVRAVPGLSRRSPGALGEYNGKFMCGPAGAARRLVLHAARPRARELPQLLPAGARWQMTGVRLAADGGPP